MYPTDASGNDPATCIAIQSFETSFLRYASSSNAKTPAPTNTRLRQTSLELAVRLLCRITADGAEPYAIAHAAITLRNQISFTDRNATNAAIASSIGHSGRRSRLHPIANAAQSARNAAT